MPANSSLLRTTRLIACLLGAGCANTRVSPLIAGARLEEDERRLWSGSVEEQTRLDQSRFHADLPAAEAYLDGIIARLGPVALPDGTPYRTRILVNPTLNAFAYPNGVVYVHTGLLARLENEAQLAIILAHEVTHSTHRHGLRNRRKVKNASAFLASFTVATYGLGALLGGFGTMASVSGYSQDLEHEADQGGFALLLAAGYDPREAPRAFELLRDEAVRNKTKEPFFFGSHPRLSERIANFQALLAALPEDRRRGDADSSTYARSLVQAFMLNARAALQAGDFDQVATSVERVIAVLPEDKSARLLLAEAQRKHGRDEDLKNARSSLEKLTRESPGLAPAWRELGLVLLKLDDASGAALSFQHYLTLAPSADDRPYIETLLKP